MPRDNTNVRESWYALYLAIIMNLTSERALYLMKREVNDRYQKRNDDIEWYQQHADIDKAKVRAAFTPLPKERIIYSRKTRRMIDAA